MSQQFSEANTPRPEEWGLWRLCILPKVVSEVPVFNSGYTTSETVLLLLHYVVTPEKESRPKKCPWKKVTRNFTLDLCFSIGWVLNILLIRFKGKWS